MSKTKAIVVGVSNYNIAGASNLPFCINDVVHVTEALSDGLKLQHKDIVTLGELGTVTVDDFKKALTQVVSYACEDDTLIFYFSGHGTKSNNQHYLVFSDDVVSTQDIMSFCEKTSAKGKIVFLDCCFSGEFSIEGTSAISVEEAVEDFAGRGYAVFSSSNSIQESYGHPDKPISVFTSFLCDAFRDKLIIRQGMVSLYDIQKLVSLYSQVWSHRNPDKQQQPIFRANLGGTIYFKVQEYVPYQPTKIYEECNDYIIYDVKPCHIVVTKRYSVEVILKAPLSLDEVGHISLEVTRKVRRAEVYNNANTQLHLSGKLADIIWIYFGRDETDMIGKTYLCITTWVDDAQNKDWWYRVDNEDTFMINNVHFKVLPYYGGLRRLNQEYMGSRERVVNETKNMLALLVTLAEKIIFQFNEYKNTILTERELIDGLDAFVTKVDEYYIKSTDFAIPPDEIKGWSEACSLLFGTIHDLSLYYHKKYIHQRTAENRKACMEMTITRYYSDLENVQN